MSQIQNLSQRSLRIRVGAAAVLSVAAFLPAVSASQAAASSRLSPGIAGSANAVEHRLPSHFDGDLGVDGSANAVEHRLLSHLNGDLGVDGSANAKEHASAR